MVISLNDERAKILRTLMHHVAQWEGGVAKLPGESWVTYYGQTPMWLKAWGLPRPTNAEEAMDNWVRWAVKSRLAKVCTAPDALSLSVLDFAVHSGESRSVKALQAAVGVTPDGVLGTKTLLALPTSAVDRNRVALKHLATRIMYLARLVASDRDKLVFLKGWMARCCRHLELMAEGETA